MLGVCGTEVNEVLPPYVTGNYRVFPTGCQYLSLSTVVNGNHCHGIPSIMPLGLACFDDPDASWVTPNGWRELVYSIVDSVR